MGKCRQKSDNDKACNLRSPLLPICCCFIITYYPRQFLNFFLN